MAMRLLRKGAISRATKSMESKIIGYLSDPDIIQQMQDKQHHVKLRRIGPDAKTFEPEEVVALKLEKLLGRLNNDAVP